VLADYLNDEDGALALLEQNPAASPPFASFVFASTAGSILLDRARYQEAFDQFSVALAVASDGEDDALRLTACTSGMQAAARTGNHSAAIRWCVEALRIILKTHGPKSCDAAELLGELAWLHWQAGARSRALGAAFGAVRHLLADQESEPDRIKESVRKVGHLLGWLASTASLGRPPNATADGELYAEPITGFLVRRNTILGTLPDRVGPTILYQQLGILAEALQQIGIARCAYRQAFKEALEAGREYEAGTADVHRVPLEAYLAEPERAISGLARSARAVVVMRSAISEPGLPNETRAQQLWESAPEGERLRVEREQTFWGVLWPTFVSLLEHGARKKEATALLDRLEAGLASHETEPADSELWMSCISDMRLAFQTGATRGMVGEQIAGLEGEETFRRTLLYLAITTVGDTHLAEAATAHAVVFPEALRNSRGEFISRGLATWLVSYWRRVVVERSFALSSPAFLRQEFATGSIQGDVASAARVLLAAEAATGARFDHIVRVALRDLSNM
jgi:tetratricopeptide (TPR) repeat protein